MRAPHRLLWLAALATTPFTLGADGCISEVAVGLEDPPNDTLDASTGGGDDGPDAGGLPSSPCQNAECGPAPSVPCDDGSTPQAQCKRDEAGACNWVVMDCPAPVGDGGVGPLPECEITDCQGPWVVGITVADEPPMTTRDAQPVSTCADNTEPLCKRNRDGICEFQCPPLAACGTAEGSGCEAGEFCVFTIGSCGPSEKSGGLCQTRPASCMEDGVAVCGCDGQTYANACKASAAGVSIAFVGTCEGPPPECPDGCPDPAPTGKLTLCDDGVNVSGPVCLEKADGTCGWQQLACPSPGLCSATAPKLEAGRCFTDGDCATGQVCEGANQCACGSSCRSTDNPGYCK